MQHSRSSQREILPNGSFAQVSRGRQPEPRHQRPFINQRPENDRLAEQLANRRLRSERQVEPNRPQQESRTQTSGQQVHPQHAQVRMNPQNENLVLLGDSNLHGIKPSLMSGNLRNHNYIEKFAHNGATAAHLSHYVDICLEKKPSSMIIHGGTNDIKGRNANSKSSDQIACDLIATAVKAREHGVRNVAISGIIITRDPQANLRAQEINRTLVEHCRAYNFGFIDNSDIELKHLKVGDAVHLAPNGHGKLVKNWTNYINTF